MNFQVNYSLRYTTGPLVGRLYHAHAQYESWQEADLARMLFESGREITPDDVGIFNAGSTGNYTTDDVSLFAI